MNNSHHWYLIEALEGDRWIPFCTFEDTELEEAMARVLQLNPVKKEVRLLKVTQTRELIA